MPIDDQNGFDIADLIIVTTPLRQYVILDWLPSMAFRSDLGEPVFYGARQVLGSSVYILTDELRTRLEKLAPEKKMILRWLLDTKGMKLENHEWCDRNGWVKA